MPEVFLLGAGFSRAINRCMPLLPELGEEVAKRLDLNRVPRQSRLVPEDFENWLSYLAEDQPWLEEAAHLTNRATFLHVSRVLFDVIREREAQARSTPIPAWLRALVARWHEDSATVITFNYDLLVEAAYTEVVRVHAGYDDGKPSEDRANYVSHQQLQRTPFAPVQSRTGAVLGSSSIDTFSLLKLHGSTSWFYSGRPSFYGETIYDAAEIQGWAPPPISRVPGWLVEDKVPLVVPPTTGKSGFFNNETVRSEWRRAHAALQTATSLRLIGYSFPATDTLARFLVQQGCAEDARVTVVNPDASVAKRVAGLLGAVDAPYAVTHLASVEELASEIPPSNSAPVSEINGE